MTEMNLPLAEITEITVTYPSRLGGRGYTATVVPVRSKEGDLNDGPGVVIGWVVIVNGQELPALLPGTETALGFATKHLKRVEKKDYKDTQRHVAFERRVLEDCEEWPDPRERGFLPKGRAWPHRDYTPGMGGMVTTNAPG